LKKNRSYRDENPHFYNEGVQTVQLGGKEKTSAQKKTRDLGEDELTSREKERGKLKNKTSLLYSNQGCRGGGYIAGKKKQRRIKIYTQNVREKARSDGEGKFKKFTRESHDREKRKREKQGG